MELYPVLKLLHVASAIVWVGGGFTMVLLGLAARRARNEAELMNVMRQVSVIGPRLFLPASLATLAFGVGCVVAGGLAWEAWLVLGLGGTLATAAFGYLVLRPRAEHVLAFLPDPGRRRDAIRTASELLSLARIDYALLFSVVALMVLKPGWGDIAVLGLLGSGVACIVALALGGQRTAAA